ncbi:hypothetical protein ACWDKQ_26435 [Saccharopolyspora sp. NPDC000995]
MKVYANRRVYVRTKSSGTELRADYRVLPRVSKKDAPAETANAFVVEGGYPVLNPV